METEESVLKDVISADIKASPVFNPVMQNLVKLMVVSLGFINNDVDSLKAKNYFETAETIIP